MDTQKAKMFLGEQRGCYETYRFRSRHTFNYKQYFNKDKAAIGGLYVFNDETIAGGNSINITVEENAYLLLLPLVGSLVYKVEGENDNVVNTAQLQVLHFTRPASLKLSNWYETELINFIQVRIKATAFLNDEVNKLYTFNLEDNKNQLINLTRISAPESNNPLASIGKFDGRMEAVYKIKKEQNKLFVFVIQGVFEVQGRLLHARDGLATWNSAEDTEMEALSNDAIIFIIEL